MRRFVVCSSSLGYRAYTTRTLRALIVSAHPVPTSFASAVGETIDTSLRQAGAEVRRRDLYAMPDGRPFSPLLTETERTSYFQEGKQPQLTGDPHVVDIVDSLRWADALVLVYPTWWFNLPAILKGFFDRCFVPGVGFKYDPVAGKRTVGLTNIRRCGVVTSYGFDEPTVSKAGDAGRVMIQGGMAMLFHPECEQHWDALYSMQAAQTPEQRTAFLETLRARYSAW
jgi:NAD(P)H dehydrogenase (quinone)